MNTVETIQLQPDTFREALRSFWNEVLEIAKPSLTYSVMSEAPLCDETGVIVTVRFDSLPPNTMLFVGTRVGVEEVA